MNSNQERYFILKNNKEKFKTYIQKIITVSTEINNSYFQENLLNKLTHSFSSLGLILEHDYEYFNPNNDKFRSDIFSFINELKRINFFVTLFDNEEIHKNFKASIYEDIRYMIHRAEIGLNYNSK